MHKKISFIFCLSLLTPFLSLFADDDAQWKSVFQPLPELAISTAPVDQAKISLGKALYNDKRLSLAQDLSCNSCHDLSNYGVDNKPTSPGHKNQLGGRNSPTVLNAGLHFLQFWDGRAADVEAQALGPILNPIEMAMPNEKAVLKRLKVDKEMRAAFKSAFPNEKNPLTFKNIGIAIGAFERTLITPSRFDKFLRGDEDALTDEEKDGAKRFVETGCITCHMGPTLGGMMFQKLGVVKPYQTKDLGRYEVTKAESDKYMFKVPSLRNIEKTGPYLHDGSIKTLEEIVSIMAEYQLGKELDEDEVEEIVTFLRSLTAEKY